MARLQPLSKPGSYTNAITDEALLRMQKIQAIKRPSLRSQRNVHNLIHNTQSLVSNEADWIREGPDLAALSYDADRWWLNNFLADVLNSISRTATKVSAQHHLFDVPVQPPIQHGAATSSMPVMIHGSIQGFHKPLRK